MNCLPFSKTFLFANRKNSFFQHYGALAHFSQRVRNVLNTHYPDRWVNSRSFQYHYARNGASRDAQHYSKNRILFTRTWMALRTILALKCKSELNLLGISFFKKCAILSTAKWCGKRFISSLPQKWQKRNCYLTRESISHASRERFLWFKELFLCCTVQEKISLIS